MKIHITDFYTGSRTDSIQVYNGESRIIIPKKDFPRITNIENAIKISEKCKDLNTLRIYGYKLKEYKVDFTEEQQYFVVNGVIEVFAMPFEQLEKYNFVPERKYKLHLNQECMTYAGNDKPLTRLLQSNPSIVQIVLDEDVSSIGDYAFCGCEDIFKFDIAGQISSIGNWAFYDCISMNNLILPSSVTSIGIGAFATCLSLQKLDIPENVTVLSDNLFYGCISLETFKVHSNISSIGKEMFFDCRSLTSILVDNNNYFSSLEGVLYNKNQDNLVYYPNGKLGNVYSFPSSVRTIGNDSFSGNTNLTSVTFPDSITSIGEYSFSDCEKLKSISLSSNLSAIGEGAFLGCKELNDITYRGSISNWNTLSKGANIFSPNKVIRCTDGNAN